MCAPVGWGLAACGSDLGLLHRKLACGVPTRRNRLDSGDCVTRSAFRGRRFQFPRGGRRLLAFAGGVRGRATPRVGERIGNPSRDHRFRARTSPGREDCEASGPQVVSADATDGIIRLLLSLPGCESVTGKRIQRRCR
jgi:hypothetical protein